ncbi:Predicted acetyltransferase [Alkalithermobacter thermoalcaliphilus JW-YL-7 = DSM 7308]|uniref:Predicted acetyltransferase n=1 Tax=Alkalithermobacter thermoalcaliphilus JW-YL-7 = DSM 7308 TaxID=1121328 RepID=A0A150FR65_CLOPD|nr:Sterol carrier protein domain containing protein [[Clostridium] paradoxum JW-YL-7 = DSM 7308]SHL01770.1 Predicted acetyltransferase [[Clostridium] paradoxum JW-YL-7 = DSM 7308]
MNVRKAKKEDIEHIKYMWQYCFNDPEGFFNYYFSKKYKEENTLVIEDKEILSSLQMNQYKICLNKKIYNTSYIVGVSTVAHARGKGFMKVLMKETLRELYNKNQLVSILMPIDYRLYRPYGYEQCYDQLEYNLDIYELREFKTAGDFQKATKQDINSLIDIYNFSMQNKNGFIVRDDEYFYNLFDEVSSENGHIYLHKTDTGFDGYIIYFILEDKILVREIFYKNIKTLKSFLKFIYNHNTQCKSVTIQCPLDDKIKNILPNIKHLKLNIKPFMMGRVINFKEFVKTLEVDNLNYTLRIKLEDNYIQENNKTFKIIIDSGKIIVNETDEKYDIKIDINSLSQLAFSYLSVYDLDALEKIQYQKQEHLNILNNLFRPKINYINEYV